MPPKNLASTDAMMHRIAALLESLSDSLDREAERSEKQTEALRSLLHRVITDIATLPQEITQALSSDTLDRLRHVKFWMQKLEEREPTGQHQLPAPLPPAPVPPARDPSQAIPLMLEVHGRWGANELRAKLWKLVPWLAVGGGGAALAHIHEIFRWLVAHGS
ncbi:MAG: hypothetical protein ACREQT_01380 [Candidatus Binataceae bacterium]